MTRAVHSRFGKFLLAPVLAGGAMWLPATALNAQAVIQALPPPEVGDLQSALAVLARNPTNLDALIRAGKASIAIEDLPAASGFFRRALAISPNNGEVEAGMAAIALRQGNAVEAVSLFEKAERDGMPAGSHASDHGLALDLVGDNDGAQRYYREELSRGDDPEVARRLALSQAIAGDQVGSEATLLPLLQRSDLAAYRTRAFALAILGRSDEAVSIAETMLPERLSNRMAPYLRYMPRLTRAQQAAAANLGRFPPAAEIGRDSPEIAALSARSTPRTVAVRTPDARLEPAGEPLGGTAKPNRQTRSRDTASRPATDRRVTIGKVEQVGSTPIEQPTAQQVSEPQPVQAGELPPAQQQSVPQPPVSQPSVSQPSVSQPVLVAAAEPPPAPPVQPVAASEDVPRPSLSIGTPGVVEAEPEAVEPEVSLAEAFAEFAGEPVQAAGSRSGAVDITKFEPPRQKPEPPPAPKPPANPKRYWVQVATGRDTGALGFDWRRIQGKGGALLKSNSAYTAKWGQTNRLVTGPYDTEAEALKMVKSLKDKGLDTFAFTSAQGEEVRPLK
ncbi:tetratricopeptide repeat protein [Altererythrobacter salegens]|uniref:Tetratricopeptide repeat protein n=1 Tax=Croceibacterium salegens TaxID=1737568 RepID=A0A6I4SSK5_9SPHN|nr:SPOR domain-containing protein [Croceibacterium salegens]MXO58020.1 tetratricopeptide repeat protein [Croceibacterium salegens]